MADQTPDDYGREHERKAIPHRLVGLRTHARVGGKACSRIFAAAVAFVMIVVAVSDGGAIPPPTQPGAHPDPTPDISDRRESDGARSWLGRVQRDLAAREYWASETAGGWQAPNRAQRFRTYFEPSGIRLVDRTRRAAPLIGMRLLRAGRIDALEPLEEGRIATSGARVEIRRSSLTEWFENGPEGLEHGWTVDAPPEGAGPLVFELGIEGARAEAAAGAILLRTPSGRRLRYAKLAAFDAKGRSLPARMQLIEPREAQALEGTRAGLRVVVDDRSAAGPATYPVTIDPLLTSVADSFLESDQTASRFGVRVASAGDVNGDGFDDVIIGADDYDAGETNEGAAFVFYGTVQGIPDASPLGALTQIETNQAGAKLAQVASAGDVDGDGYDDVLVGAPFYDLGQTDEGIAMIFLGGPAGIPDGDPSNAHAILEANDAGAFFGASVSGAGDLNGDGYADVVVGAYRFDDTPSGIEGAAFVYHGSASGVDAIADAAIAGGATNDRFGRSVSGAGDVNGDGFADLIVGAELADGAFFLNDAGRAYVFHGSASGIGATDANDADGFVEGEQPDARAGIRVAGAGDVNGDGYADVLVGANLFDAGEVDEGAVWILPGSATGIGFTVNPSAIGTRIESDQADAHLGFGLGGAGDVNGDGYSDIVVGARFYDDGETDEGAAFVYLGGAAGIPNGTPATADYVFTLDQASAEVGEAVAGAGDVNGDGLSDIVIGAYRYDVTTSGSNEGIAVVLHGGGEGILDASPATADTLLQSDQVDARFGVSAAAAGDVNGDGYDDVIVGADRYDGGVVNGGAAFVFHGSAAGIGDATPVTAATELLGDTADQHVGRSVAGVGDLDGDGYADVAISGREMVSATFFNVRAFVFSGGPLGIVDSVTSAADATITIDGGFGFEGTGVASAGDVNGDGYADLLVGASGYDDGATDTGAAFVYHGGYGGLGVETADTADGYVLGDQAGGGVGYSIAGVGDVNGDGYGDVAVGAREYDVGRTDSGAVFLFHGGPNGIGSNVLPTASATLSGAEAFRFLGQSVAFAGDTNQDGYADLLIAGETTVGISLATVYGFLRQGGPQGIAAVSLASTDATFELVAGTLARSGTLFGAGDVNGDGYADIVAGASGFPDPDSALLFAGGALVYEGGPLGFVDEDIETATTTIQGDQSSSHLGSAAAGAGDVNGDGFADLILGGLGYDLPQTDEGVALVHLGGRGGTARPLVLRQQSPTSLLPIAPGGLSRAAGAFLASMEAFHPEGAGRVRLEVEACPSGVAFGAGGCVLRRSPDWVPVLPDGSGGETATLEATVDGLSDGTLYRWRARVLHAPFALPGGASEPVNPDHGPWRRPHAGAFPGDVRVPEPGFAGSLLVSSFALLRLARGRCRRRR